MSENLCIFEGLLGNDIELAETGQGKEVCTYSLYTKKTWKRGSRTTRHRCVSYGKDAIYLAEYAEKGDVIYFRGYMTNKTFEADGDNQVIDEFVSEKVNVVRKKSERIKGDE